ncbi:metal-dependent phosphohydrolase, partial [Streptomyces sp. NPDC058964]
METVPAQARRYVVCAAVLALLCLLPLPRTHAPWWAVALLTALYAACEHLVRGRFGGTFYPVLLAGAFLLPPPAAVLVALHGAATPHAAERCTPQPGWWSGGT